MLAHRTHFDEHPTREYFAARGGAPADGDSAKITSGAPGDNRYTLSPDLKADFDEIWRKLITPRFGFEDYPALRQAISGLAPPKG
jgi:hypothetical protein